MTVDLELRHYFEQMRDSVNLKIDELMQRRDDTAPPDKYALRYYTKKLEVIVGACNRTIDKMDELENK